MAVNAASKRDTATQKSCPLRREGLEHCHSRVHARTREQCTFETRKAGSFNTKSKIAAACEPGWLTEGFLKRLSWSPVTGMKNEAVDIDLSHAQRLTIFPLVRMIGPADGSQVCYCCDARLPWDSLSSASSRDSESRELTFCAISSPPSPLIHPSRERGELVIAAALACAPLELGGAGRDS